MVRQRLSGATARGDQQIGCKGQSRQCKRRVDRVQEQRAKGLGPAPGGPEVDGEGEYHFIARPKPKQTDQGNAERPECPDAPPAREGGCKGHRHGGCHGIEGQACGTDLQRRIDRIALPDVLPGNSGQGAQPQDKRRNDPELKGP